MNFGSQSVQVVVESPKRASVIRVTENGFSPLPYRIETEAPGFYKTLIKVRLLKATAHPSLRQRHRRDLRRIVAANATQFGSVPLN